MYIQRFLIYYSFRDITFALQAGLIKTGELIVSSLVVGIILIQIIRITLYSGKC